MVLTVYGIETRNALLLNTQGHQELQQHLPFTVLKHEREVLDI